jgi:hypothetical protein
MSVFSDDLGHELRTQDNACTAHPIYVVQRKRRLYGLDPNYCEHVTWLNAPNDFEECDSAEFDRLESEYQDTGETPCDWTRTGYRDDWEFVQPFLTKKAAEAYILAQKHNLGDARVYVASGYGNAEWQFIRAHFSGSD